MTWPPALSTSTLTVSAAEVSSKPPCPTPSAMSIRLPGTITSRPTSAAPCSACICTKWVFRPSTVLFSFWMPLTVLICAIWLVTCALSIGLSGSWFCICATRSFRKRSELPAASSATGTLGVELTAVVVVLLWEVIGANAMRVPGGFQSSGPHLQRLEQQRLRRVHDLDVVLVRTRGRDHVDHLLDRVDVAVGDVALGVGARVLGVVHAPAGALVFADVADSDARCPHLAHQLGLEGDLARLVGLAVGAGDGVGIGEVGGDDVETLALRRDRTTGDIEDVQHAHH